MTGLRDSGNPALTTRSVRPSRWLEGRKNLWCRLGLHRWYLGTDFGAEGSAVVALCGDCGLMEIATEGRPDGTDARRAEPDEEAARRVEG